MNVGAGESVDVRQQFLAGMRDAAGEIIAVACGVLLELPAYRSLEDGDDHDVREFTSWLFDVFLTCLDEDRGLSPAETAGLVAVGRRRSDQGIDHGSFTAAFEIVYDRSHARLVDLAAGLADPAVTTVLGNLSQALGSLSRAAVLAVATGFEETHEPAADTDMPAASALLKALMTGVADRAHLTESAEVLGLAADDALHIVIAVPSDEQTEDLEAVLGVDRGDGLGLVASAVRQTPVRHAVGLVTASSDRPPLAAAHDRGDAGPILITHRLRGVGDLGTQYTTIRPYLHLAQHLADGRVVSLDDLRLFAVLGTADLKDVESFVRRRLGDVLAQEPDQAKTMLDTIEAYLETGSSNILAGERLNLHRKSVEARLRKIQQDTTVTLDTSVDRMLTLLAVQLLRTHGPDLPDPGDECWAG